MTISQASIEDSEEILGLQKLAYRIEAERYNDYSIPPLTQTLEQLRQQFADHTILKAVTDGRIVGTVRAHEEKGTCHVGRLAVHPAMQDQGIGAALMREIEKYFASKRFELFVGSRSDNNIHLYKKLGYQIFRKAGHECGHIEIYYMEKILEDGQ